MPQDAYNRPMKSFDLAGGKTSILTVTQLNQRARDCLENNFAGIDVEGEISDLVQHRSGHWYFTLKDEKSQLRSAMFKYQNKSIVSLRLEDDKSSHAGQGCPFSKSSI